MTGHLIAILTLIIWTTPAASILSDLDLPAILQALNDSCVVVELKLETKNASNGYSNVLLALRESSFNNDGSVLFGTSNYSNLVNDSNIRISTVPALTRSVNSTIIVLPKKIPDRSCLLTNGLIHKELKGGLYDGRPDPVLILSFINEYCGTYKSIDGGENESGHRRLDILRNVYSIDRGPTMKTIFEHCSENGNLKHFFYTGQCRDRIQLPTCEVIDGQSLTKNAFFENYLIRSKPVIIKNLLPAIWKNSQHWTNEFFRRHFGHKNVHIKLTPHGEFEGVEDALLWSSCPESEGTVDQFCHCPLADIPEEVVKHLKYSKNLLLVRPASMDMRMDEFIDLIENGSSLYGYTGKASAYLEYTPVGQHFTGFDSSLPEMPFMKDLLKLDLLNMWLSDGNTLGKLHFDQYENLLCQVSGKKRIILFEPHNNSRLYEGHIVEAMLSFRNGQFLRHELMESTALTMSPVDIEKPNFSQFPEFAKAMPINCTIEAGDILFMPSFWWHEVQSYPDPQLKRNLAFNFWYEPFLSKEFPCIECKIDINPRYRHHLCFN